MPLLRNIWQGGGAPTQLQRGVGVKIVICALLENTLKAQLGPSPAPAHGSGPAPRPAPLCPVAAGRQAGWLRARRGRAGGGR